MGATNARRRSKSCCPRVERPASRRSAVKIMRDGKHVSARVFFTTSNSIGLQLNFEDIIRINAHVWAPFAVPESAPCYCLGLCWSSLLHPTWPFGGNGAFEVAHACIRLFRRIQVTMEAGFSCTGRTSWLRLPAPFSRPR